jgi:hypothetical protein
MTREEKQYYTSVTVHQAFMFGRISLSYYEICLVLKGKKKSLLDEVETQDLLFLMERIEVHNA